MSLSAVREVARRPPPSPRRPLLVSLGSALFFVLFLCRTPAARAFQDHGCVLCWQCCPPPAPSSPRSHQRGSRSNGILCSARKELRGGQQHGAEGTMPEALAACPELSGMAGARWPCTSMEVSKASQSTPGLCACTAEEGSPALARGRSPRECPGSGWRLSSYSSFSFAPKARPLERLAV